MKTITNKLILSAFIILLNVAVFAQNGLDSKNTSNEPCCSISIQDTVELYEMEEYDIEVDEDGNIIEYPMDILIEKTNAMLEKQSYKKKIQNKDQILDLAGPKCCI